MSALVRLAEEALKHWNSPTFNPTVQILARSVVALEPLSDAVRDCKNYWPADPKPDFERKHDDLVRDVTALEAEASQLLGQLEDRE